MPGTHLLRGPVPQLRPGRCLPGRLLRLEFRGYFLHREELCPGEIDPHSGSSLPRGYRLQARDGVGLAEEYFHRLPPAADGLVHRVPLFGVDLMMTMTIMMMERRRRALGWGLYITRLPLGFEDRGGNGDVLIMPWPSYPVPKLPSPGAAAAAAAAANKGKLNDIKPLCQEEKKRTDTQDQRLSPPSKQIGQNGRLPHLRCCGEGAQPGDHGSHTPQHPPDPRDRRLHIGSGGRRDGNKHARAWHGTSKGGENVLERG